MYTAWCGAGGGRDCTLCGVVDTVARAVDGPGRWGAGACRVPDRYVGAGACRNWLVVEPVLLRGGEGAGSVR